MLLVFSPCFPQCENVDANATQFMKTRSSAGVGQKVDLAFDIAGLRISDSEDEEQKTEAQETSALYNKIKRKTMADEETNPKCSGCR